MIRVVCQFCFTAVNSFLSTYFIFIFHERVQPESLITVLKISRSRSIRLAIHGSRPGLSFFHVPRVNLCSTDHASRITPLQPCVSFTQQYAYVPEWAKKILMKSAMERSENELSQLHSMLKGLTSYDKFTYRIQLAMCRAMTYLK